jgi:hypothetical protein
MGSRQHTLSVIDAFLAETGMSEREFSLNAVGHHRFVARLRRGEGVTLTTIEKAERFMADWRRHRGQDNHALAEQGHD